MLSLPRCTSSITSRTRSSSSLSTQPSPYMFPLATGLNLLNTSYTAFSFLIVQPHACAYFATSFSSVSHLSMFRFSTRSASSSSIITCAYAARTDAAFVKSASE